MNSEETVIKLLSFAGIEIDGNNPWDIQLNNDDIYDRVITSGSLGLGESYTDGWWDCHQLDEFFCRILSKEIESKIKQNWPLLANILRRDYSIWSQKEELFRLARGIMTLVTTCLPRCLING